MPVVTLFKNRKGNCNIATPDGQLIKFARGRHYTQNPAHEEYLQLLAERKEAGVYIDPAEPDIDTENASPTALMEKRVRDQVLKDLASGKINIPATTNPGNTEPQPLQNSTTNTFGTATSKGTDAMAQKLAAAKAQASGKVEEKGTSGKSEEPKK